jgi:Domain of unknown function (DUF4349)
MEMRRDDFELASELRALRPSPRVAFTEELDARVAAGFAQTGDSKDGLLGPIARALRNSSPRRLVLPAGVVALTAIVVATAVIAIGQTGNDVSAPRQVVDARGSVEREAASGHPSASSKGGAEGDALQYSEAQLSAGAATAKPSAGYQASGPASKYQASAAEPTAGHRAVERDAELVLRTGPGEIGKASREVFEAVHAANGVVLSSSVRDQGGESSAHFQLLVPSTQLGDALAGLSQIAEVRSRHESTLDITAPTVSARDRLKDSEATIEGMLAQLGATEGYEERALLERQLRQERQQAAVLRSQLDQLQRRADFAHISLRIESGSDAGAAISGRWGVDDALRDAGRILAIAAGVAVIALAVIGPIALIALLAWLAQRIWLRQRRERALS